MHETIVVHIKPNFHISNLSYSYSLLTYFYQFFTFHNYQISRCFNFQILYLPGTKPDFKFAGDKTKLKQFFFFLSFSAKIQVQICRGQNTFLPLKFKNLIIFPNVIITVSINMAPSTSVLYERIHNG